MSATDDLLDSVDTSPRYGNDDLMWKLESVGHEIDSLRDLIIEVQRAQMWSNTRIRQDVVSMGVSLFFLSIAIIGLWSHTQWQSWYLLVPAFIAPLMGAYLYHQVAKQDEPAWPTVSLDREPTEREIEVAEGRKRADERLARWRQKRLQQPLP